MSRSNCISQKNYLKGSVWVNSSLCQVSNLEQSIMTRGFSICSTNVTDLQEYVEHKKFLRREHAWIIKNILGSLSIEANAKSILFKSNKRKSNPRNQIAQIPTGNKSPVRENNYKLTLLLIFLNIKLRLNKMSNILNIIY